ncbi:hypothetical protein Tco_1189160 [Tanacetum coccineum]
MNQGVEYDVDLVLIQVVKWQSAQTRVNPGVGPLSGKGLRVIVSADVSTLSQPVFVYGGATGAALKDQNTTAFKEVAITRHPRLGEYASGFIMSSVVLQKQTKYKIVFYAFHRDRQAQEKYYRRFRVA